MGIQQPLTTRERTARRRAVMREAGLRPRQFWLPDVNDPEVKAEIARACAVIAASDQTDDLAFAAALQYWPPIDKN
jgi:hypothetical protein